MKKILTFTLFIAIITVCTINTGFSPQNNQEIINRINKIYNSYLTIKSEFKQIDSFGKVSKGWFVFDKKNSKARIEYTNTPLRIIINNNSIMLEQTDLKEKTFSPLVASPFRYIFNNNTLLDSKELTVSKLIHTKNGYDITITPNEDSFKGSITLKFNNNSYLSGWVIVDEIGNTTKVFLTNPSYSNKKVPASIFNTHRVINLNFNSIK